ncbi:hypothetical protein AVEN_41071-1 [Araneus ventricosus]|uniref:Uncharacterized protein n=1 Tax=Araneus ventricosus TaxID=182803 RepID=A0A4Y2CJZ3_ARAVE|nr:hypothetical protein AVEN_41071-1 [Araneus ventricosus]
MSIPYYQAYTGYIYYSHTIKANRINHSQCRKPANSMIFSPSYTMPSNKVLISIMTRRFRPGKRIRSIGHTWRGARIPTLARPTQEVCKADTGPSGREPPHQHVEDGIY